MTAKHTPLVMGLLMGPMLVWMLHGQLTNDTSSGAALVLFVGVHLLLLAVVTALALFATRLSPRLQSLSSRLHRPSLAHLSMMLTGVLLSASALHFAIHGLT